MFFLYNILLVLTSQLVKVLALFSPKIKLFVNGRKAVFETLSTKINPEDQTIWFHAASLGEYEQGLPVMERIKQEFPKHACVRNSQKSFRRPALRNQESFKNV